MGICNIWKVHVLPISPRQSGLAMTDTEVREDMGDMRQASGAHALSGIVWRSWCRLWESWRTSIMGMRIHL